MKRNLYFLLLLVAFLENTNAQTVGVFQNDSMAFNGYTLLFPNVSESTWLLDNCGNVVHQWESEYKPGLVAYLLENGDLLRTARIGSNFNGGGSGGRVERYNWDGELIWSYNHSTPEYHQHHDIEYLPNGNILIIAWERRSSDEAIEMGKNPQLLNNDGMWAEQIVEIEPNGETGGEIVWEWHLWDHLIQDFDSTKVNYGVVADHPELMNLNAGAGGIDWIHFNAIDYNAELDQIVLSSRHMSEIYIIDHSTTTAEAASHEGGNTGKGGDILYRWGNPQVYDRGEPSEQKLYGQHDVQWIGAGLVDEGKLMVFNNGIGRPDGDYSSVDIWQPPLMADGNYLLNDASSFQPTNFSWSFTSTNGVLFSSNISGAQRLPNGNTLICEGRPGRLLEVNYNGNHVWEYVSPVVSQGFITQGNTVNNNNIFRAYRYAPDYPAFADVELVAGGPLELEPTNQSCIIHDGTVVSTGEPSLILKGVGVVTNPIGDQISIENKTGEAVFFEMTDLTGRIVFNGEIQGESFNKTIEELNAGLYLIRFVNAEGNRFFVEKVMKY